MPRFMGGPQSPSSPFPESLVGVLVEKTATLSTLTDLLNPVDPRRPPFLEKKSLRSCGKVDSMYIPMPHILPRLLLRFHYVLPHDSRLGSDQGYARLIAEERGAQLTPGIDSDRSLSAQRVIVYPQAFPDDEPSMGPFFWKEIPSPHLLLVQRIFITLLSKSEHKGVTFDDIDLFIQGSVFRFLARLNYVVKRILPHLIHTQILSPAFPWCVWQRLGFAKYGWSRPQFARSPVFKGPPCLHCPSLAECTPQGSITPFDCTYIESWER